MTDKIDDGRRVAKIYFRRGFESLVKDMAASIRNQKSHAHLINAQLFTEPDNVLAANAVLIQASAHNARFIGRTYSNYGAAGVEILFFNDEGKITQLDLVEPSQSIAGILGTEDEGTDNGKQVENDTGQQTAGLLGTEADTASAGTDAAAGSADITGGNSAEDADNIKS